MTAHQMSGRTGRVGALAYWRVALLLVLALFAAACGTEDPETATPNETTSEEPDSSEGTELNGEAAEPSGPLLAAWPESPQHVDFQGAVRADDQLLGAALGDTLVRIAPMEPEAEEMRPVDDLVPGLATDWSVGEDGVTLMLGDAKSSFGNEISAEDVKWSFERGPAVGGAWPFFLYPLVDLDPEAPVTIIDDKTVRVNSTHALILPVLANINAFPVFDSTEAKKHASDDDPWATEWLQQNVASYGPYIATSIVPGQEVRLAANPNYAGELGYDEVVVRSIGESSARLQLLESGEVNYARLLNNADFASIQGDEGLYTPVSPGAGQQFLQPTMGEGTPTADVRIRQAISLAIDREGLAQGPYRGLALPAKAFFSQYMPQGRLAEPFEYDPEKAKQLIGEAGYEDRAALTLGSYPGALFSSGADTEAVLVYVQQNLAAVGFNVSLIIEPSRSAYDAGIASKKYDVGVRSSITPLTDAAFYLTFAHPTGAYHNVGFSDPEVDEAVFAALDEPLGERRDQLTIEANNLIRQHMPTIPLVDPSYYEAFTDGVTGFLPRNDTWPPLATLHPKS